MAIIESLGLLGPPTGQVVLVRVWNGGEYRSCSRQVPSGVSTQACCWRWQLVILPNPPQQRVERLRKRCLEKQYPGAQDSTHISFRGHSLGNFNFNPDFGLYPIINQRWAILLGFCLYSGFSPYSDSDLRVKVTSIF